MHTLTGRAAGARSPLEEFLREYVEVTGGACDEIEPQVYDVLFPAGDWGAQLGVTDREIVRITFDPEALPEHPGSQLASLGAPLVDRLLAGAVRRGRYAQVYFNGLNLVPYDLAGRVRRAVTLGEGLEVAIQRARALHFAQAVFWFEATFTSDQKEQEILPMAIDLHTSREVRHLERLLDYGRLGDQPAEYLAEARRCSLAAAYPQARREVIRTVASLANIRRRELAERLDRQVERMSRYYSDLRSELEEQLRRARDRGDDLAKLAARRETLDREERLRISELRQKSALRVRLRLVNLLVIQQPKLLLRCLATSRQRASLASDLELVWDPLVESLEAASCPGCGRPTYSLELARQSRLGCPGCKSPPRVGR